MYIYAFGSLCRGELDCYSDFDLLIVTDSMSADIFDISKYSVYTLEKIKHFWKMGNPFAWHLYLESQLIFSQTGDDLLRNLGRPKKYSCYQKDAKKFYNIFLEAKESLNNSIDTSIFELSCIFLCIRNIATISSFCLFKRPIFARNSAIMLENHSINIESYNIYEKARLLATRGVGEIL